MDQLARRPGLILKPLLTRCLRANCPGLPPIRLRGVWRAVNTVALLMWVVGSACPAAGQDLTAAQAIRAQQAVQRWVEQSEVDDTPAEAITGGTVFGVRVTLRYQGHPMGAGEAYRSDVAAALTGGTAVDVLGLLRTATDRALDDVRRRLDAINASARAVEDIDHPIGAGKTLTDVASNLLSDVQIGYGLEPVRIPKDAPPTAILGGFVPGYHGLRVPNLADAAQPGAITWPATALAGNIPPSRQILGLIDAAGYPAPRVNETARPGGPPLQRFRVEHVVRPSQRLPAMRLVRGNDLLPPSNITDEELDLLTRQLGEKLGDRLIGQQLVRGTYHPSSARWDPELADPGDAALALFALARHQEVMDQLNHPMSRRVSATLADTTLTRTRAAVHAPDLDLSTGALLLLAMAHQPALADEAELRSTLVDRLLAMQQAPGQFVRSTGRDESAGDAAHAVLAAALADHFEQTRQARVGQVLVALMTRLQDRLVKAPSLSSVYWLARARAVAAARLPEEAALWEQMARTLRQIVDQLAERQIVGAPAAGPADVVGGFDFAATPVGAAPQPTWRTAQALALLAVVLRDPAIHEDADQLGWMLTAGLAARFLDQLTLGAPEAYYVRSPDIALHGLRLSMIDNRLATASAAMGALATTELSATLDWVREAIAPLSSETEGSTAPAPDRAETGQQP